MATFKDVQAAVSDIAARLNASPELARAALINPILTLEELGFELDLSGRLELEDRARFTKKQIVQRQRLRKKIFTAAGREFDPGQEDDLSAVLFDELKLDDGLSKRPDLSPLIVTPNVRDDVARPAKLKRIKASQISKTFPIKAKSKSISKRDAGLIEDMQISDPLAALERAHKVVKPVLEYRQLDAKTPRFAPEPLYRAVRTGKRRLANVTPRAVVTGAG